MLVGLASAITGRVLRLGGRLSGRERASFVRLRARAGEVRAMCIAKHVGMLAVAKIRGIPATIFGEEIRRQNPATPDGEERADRQRAPRRRHVPAARFRFARVAALFAARSLASLSR